MVDGGSSDNNLNSVNVYRVETTIIPDCVVAIAHQDSCVLQHLAVPLD